MPNTQSWITEMEKSGKMDLLFDNRRRSLSKHTAALLRRSFSRHRVASITQTFLAL